VHFTLGRGALYATLLELPGSRTFVLRGVVAGSLRQVELLASDGSVDWGERDGALSVTLPERLPVSPAHVLRLTPAPRWHAP
jgi:alpha-L-fucosidase